MKAFALFHMTENIFREGIWGTAFPFTPENYEFVMNFPKRKFPTLDSVFGASQNITTHWNLAQPCRSTSVGDMIKDCETGQIWMVDKFGFKEIK